jgi:hypothetical protein
MGQQIALLKGRWRDSASLEEGKGGRVRRLDPVQGKGKENFMGFTRCGDYRRLDMWPAPGSVFCGPGTEDRGL